MKTKMKKIFLIFASVLVVPVFVWQQVSFWGGLAQAADTTSATATDVDQSVVEDKKDSIADIIKEREKMAAAKAKLEQKNAQIGQAVAATQGVINKTKSTIQETNQNISKKESEINNLNDQIDLQTELLKSFLRQMYYNQGQPMLNIVLTDTDFSKAFSDIDHLSTLEDKIISISKSIAEQKNQIQQDKVELADIKQQHEQALDDKLDQKQDLVAQQIDTQRSIADKQKSIDRLNKELNELQGDLNSLLGKSYSAKNIMDAVEFASGKTNVPKGFLIGVLKMETNLGANVGGCTYGEVESGAQASYKAGKLGKVAWATFQRRRDIFKGITDELDLDYKKQKVSCNPKGYTGTGGAMGVAQFMPDTWNGYKKQVSSITGNNPASPWDLGDGVMAMALKLGRTPGVTDGKKSAMKSAACSYLGTCYAPYINGILYWADNYKDLLN